MSTPDLPEPLPGFTSWLEDHAQGHVADELTAKLAELVENVGHVQKAGDLVIKVHIEPAGGNQPTRQVKTSVTVTSKLPQFDPAESLFYVGDGGGLHRDDPYQSRLGRDVPVDRPAGRDID